MLIIAKVFASLFALLVIARSITDYKGKKESLTMTIFWVSLWLAIIIFTFFPNLIDLLIKFLGGNKTGLGTIFGMTIVFVLFINYRIYVKAQRMEQALDKIARQVALNNAILTTDKKKKKK